MEELKAARAKQAAEANLQKQQDIQQLWDKYLPHYQRMLIVLHDLLTREATTKGDGISQSVDYFTSLPKTIDPKIGDFQIAKIGFQKDTNMDFVVTITAMNDANDRRFKITSSCGTLLMDLSYGDELFTHIHIAPDFDDAQHVSGEKVDEWMVSAIKGLIREQESLSRKTNMPATNPQ